jgi:hypothetical protein
MEQGLVCYCFNYTLEDIQKDFSEHGRSTFMDRIMQEKKEGKCNCENTNPKGR